MSMFRKLFYRKPPDGLLEICDRVYGYVAGVISQLQDHYPDVSIMVFNFREGESQSLIANALSEYDVTIMDYPRRYEGCPLLSMEMINHFLRSCESWLSLGQQNVLLMHCEWGGWPILAFMLAALLIYRRHFTEEQKTLDMIYKQAPHELLQLLQPLNPFPSQLRYLQYVARRNMNKQWTPLDRALTLDCIIIRTIPNFDGEGGCWPIFRIYGQDPLIGSDRSPKILFSTLKKNNVVRYYKQADCELAKIDINCHIHGDVVLECLSLHDDREELMFRTMFNTSFIRSNILILNRDQIDTLWDAKDQFSKDFRAEVLLSEMDVAASVIPADLSITEEKDDLTVEAFAKVQEISNCADWLNQKRDAAGNMLQQVTVSNLILEKLESSPETTDSSTLIDQAALEKLQEMQGPAALKPNAKGLRQSTLEQKVVSYSEQSSEAYHSNKLVETQGEMKMSKLQPSIHLSKSSSTGSRVESKTQFQIVKAKSEMKISKLQPSVASPLLISTGFSVEANASITSSPVSTHAPKTAEHPSLHGQECGKLKEVSSLPEIKIKLLKTDVLASPSPPRPPLPAKDQGIVTGQPLSTPPMSPALVTPLKDKLVTGTVSSSSQPSPSRDQPPNTVYMKDDRTTMSQPDTPLLPQLMPSSPHEDDKVAKMEPTLPTCPSRSSPVAQPPITSFCSSSASIPNIKHSGEKLVIKSGTSPSPPPLPHSIPVVEENSFSVSGIPCTPAPAKLPSKENLNFSCGPSPAPAPSIPLLPPTLSPYLLLTTPVLTKNCSPISEPPQPLPPPTLPLKERLVTKGRVLSPPPPPLPGKPVKESSSFCGGSCPPPPPLLPALQASKPTDIYAVPPPPTPHSLGSSLKDNNNLPQSVPSVRPPPVPFPKVDAESGCGRAQSVSRGSEGNNLPAFPSPTPPVAPPRGPKFRGVLSSTITSRSNSTKKLKPFHWSKISRSDQGSFWDEIEKCKDASRSSVINMSELEYFFSQNLDQIGSGRNGNSRTQKLQKVQLIDHRRAYNCEIMLSKVKIPLHDMLSSVLALEDSALEIDQVENLIKFCPTKEEMEVLKGYKEEKEKLGRCELFMLELMQVPRIESKLQVFSYKIQFQSQISDLRNNLNIVNSAVDQIRGSSKLKGILQTILYLGNALNQGTARGTAAGFKLDCLLKLTDTRSWNNKMTLMHYLCKILADKRPELLDFSKDLSSLEPALKIQLKFLAEEMQAISKGLENVIQELSMSESDGPVSENFCKALKEFLSYAEGEVMSLAQLFSVVGRDVDSLIIYFGEVPARCPFEQVVQTMFNEALEENRKQLEFERKKAEKEAREKQKTIASDKET